MVKLPRRPPPLALPPAVGELEAGTLLWRLYRRGGGHPSVWNAFRTAGPLASMRFDHHPVPAGSATTPAVLYASSVGPACLAEAYQQSRVIHRLRDRPHLVAFETTRALRLIELTGLWPTAAGASQAISSGPRASSRAWAQAIVSAYPGYDGLRYPSSMYANQPLVVLYETAADAVPGTPVDDMALADPDLTDYVMATARDLRYRVVHA